MFNKEKFTFQYATTLINKQRSSCVAKFVFTFQYATTLMLAFEDGVIVIKHIYIPICHYFNHQGP